MYPLDEILRPDFGLSSEEAVALVQEIALAVGDLGTLPAPEDLFLEDDGTVAIGFASEVRGDMVTSLATLLLQLLDGVTVPDGLRTLAADNAKTPPARATVADFTRALALYESPDRQRDLHSIVARLSARKAAVNAERELEALRRRVSSSAEDGRGINGTAAVKPGRLKWLHPKLPFRVPQLKLKQFSVRQAAIAGCVIAALLGTLAVVGLARGRSVRDREAAVVATAPSETDAGARSPKSASRTVSGKSSAALDRPSPQQTPHRTLASSASSRAALLRFAPVPLQTRTAPIPPMLALPGAPLVAKASPSPAAAKSVKPAPAETDSIPAPPPHSRAEPLPGHVYSAAEATVKPARLTHSQMPQEPAATADTGYFDIIVDEHGDVEFVRLLSPTRRYQDRMLVAAAKAWKFTPALLNGTPVKYRMRIPIILPDIPR
jgi:hypothetical protein